MKKLKFAAVVLTLVILITSCDRPPGFIITGTTHDVADQTKLYLLNISNKEILDSTSILNNTYRFEGTIEQSPANVLIHSKDFKLAKLLWLENTNIMIDAATGSFEGGRVTGSKTEMLAQKLFSRTDTIQSESQRKEVTIDFIKNHPGSVVSASLLSGYASKWGKKITSELYDLMPEEIKKSTYGQHILNYLELSRNPQIGDNASQFAMPDVNGNYIRPSDYEGQILLVHFWASGDEVSRLENKNLVKIYHLFHGLGFEIISVALDHSPQLWKKSIAADGLKWPQVCDFQGQYSKAAIMYGIEDIPDNFLIDQKGIIIARDIRGRELYDKLSNMLFENK